MKTKKINDICHHQNIGYGKISQWFIIDCCDCGKKLRIDDWDTQKKCLEEFILSCKCGETMEINQKVNEKCKWSDFSIGYCDEIDFVKPGCLKHRQHVGADQVFRNKYSHPDHIPYKFCPYCGIEIEEIK